MNINIPLDVPKKYRSIYKSNFKKATQGTGKLFLFAGDQKIEHLNEDFSNKLGFKNSDPEHLFKIASQAKIGVFAAHLGLISRYGKNYKKIPYLIKLNGKTNAVKSKDPLSLALWGVEDVINFKKQTNLNILGVGYTLYLGSEYENQMMTEISKIVFEAHQNGLLVVLWIYPRGKNIKNEKSVDILAGSAGVALCLGADFVKLTYPFGIDKLGAEKFKEVVMAGGNTGVICSGGKKIKENDFLKMVENQIKIAGTRGCAIGRNMHQNDLKSAIKLAEKINNILKK